MQPPGSRFSYVAVSLALHAHPPSRSDGEITGREMPLEIAGAESEIDKGKAPLLMRSGTKELVLYATMIVSEPNSSSLPLFSRCPWDFLGF